METTTGDETVPGELVAVQALVNTVELESNEDQLDSPEALRRFLTGHGLLGPSEPVGQADLALAVELREALRAMLRVNHGEPLDPAALEVVNRAAAALPLQVGFDAEGQPVLGPGSAGPTGSEGSSRPWSARNRRSASGLSSRSSLSSRSMVLTSAWTATSSLGTASSPAVVSIRRPPPETPVITV